LSVIEEVQHINEFPRKNFTPENNDFLVLVNTGDSDW
jgi:hypothetical protein